MHKYYLCITICVAMYAPTVLAEPVLFSEDWEIYGAGIWPGLPWYVDPHMTDGGIWVLAAEKYNHTSGGNQGLAINLNLFNNKDAGEQAKLVPDGQWVEATDASPLTVRYYAKSSDPQKADWYFEISMGDVHAPRLADVGYDPLPSPIPVLAYCKPFYGVEKLAHVFDGQKWHPAGYIGDPNAWVMMNMSVDSANINVPGHAPKARQYLGGFDRVSIYTLDYLNWAYTTIDDVYIAGGNVVDPLDISPASGLSSTGVEGGPFVPQCKTYTLTNLTDSSLDWAASSTESWITITPNLGTLPAGDFVEVDVCINANANALGLGSYTDVVEFTNSASAVVQTRDVELNVRTPDYYTEEFTENSDLANKTLTLTPNGSAAYYGACNESASQFPVDPAGGTALDLADNDFEQVTLAGGAQVQLYGVAYSHLYVGSNGYITFGAGDTDATETLAKHFSLPRISGLYTDLTPDPGQVTFKQLLDRAVVTWQSVGEMYMPIGNSFQIEMFFDGRIRMTWLSLYTSSNISGISEGSGTPVDYMPSVLTAFVTCEASGDGHPADYDDDGDVDLIDFAHIQVCYTGTDMYVYEPECAEVDFDLDGDVDIDDVQTFIGCVSGPTIPLTEGCEN